MATRSHKVWLVVDPRFGERLASLPTGQPTWIVDSPVNKPVIQRLRLQRPDRGTHFTGITSFVGVGTPDDDLVERLDDIDLHHGAYGEIEVIGAAPSDAAIQRLKELGFRIAAMTNVGFIAVRTE